MKVIGIIGFWNLYNYVVPDDFDLRQNKCFYIACNYTFFIYLFHEPTLNIVRKLLVLPFHQSSLGFAFSYLISPWVFAAIWILVGVGSKTIFPKAYNICVGGR